MYDVILKKRDGGCLSEEEIRGLVSGYTKGEIPDYQMAAFLMAVYFQGMTDEETAILTDAMAHSGDMLDLSGIPGVKVDKHSTGGVGDKTTLVVAPIVAACGCHVAKMSGRGLGHTGGTVDKMESIPGMKVELTREEFIETAQKAGIAVTGQSGNMTPADKKLYALRDVTGTVESIPLIASSIMSKKLAAGSDCILLDVKTGSGAFMKTVEDSVKLAEKMVAIGTHNHRKTAALITNMDLPLGTRIGNALEVQEAVQTLRGEGPADLTQVCLALATEMLYLAGTGSREECRARAEHAVASGAALDRLAAMVRCQGGDESCIYHPEKLGQAPITAEVKAPADGYITAMDTTGIGISAMMLGAGRETKESQLDYLAGIILKKKTGDPVQAGETIAVLLTSEEQKIAGADQRFLEAVTIQEQEPEKEPLIYARVSSEGVTYLQE
jgi:pyrimidine-nucleoside phosphorylase